VGHLLVNYLSNRQ